MSELTNKASYLKGLQEGMKLDTSKSEGKLFSEIIDLLGSIAERIELIEDEQDYVADKIEEIEGVIDILGHEIYADDDDRDCDCDDCFCVTCENCGEQFEITDEDIMDGSTNCPYCGHDIEFDFKCDCDCEDCEHDHECE